MTLGSVSDSWYLELVTLIVTLIISLIVVTFLVVTLIVAPYSNPYNKWLVLLGFGVEPTCGGTR